MVINIDRIERIEIGKRMVEKKGKKEGIKENLGYIELIEIIGVGKEREVESEGKKDLKKRESKKLE